jgi:hypothetical protein
MSSAKHGGMSDIKMITGFCEIPTSLFSFIFSSLIQWNINPSTKLALLVPNRLTMSHEYNFEVAILFLIHLKDVIGAFG